MTKKKIKKRKLVQVIALFALLVTLICRGTYSYLIARDSKINSIELLNPPPEIKIGDSVNYSVTVNSGTENEVALNEWKVLQVNENDGYVDMILSDYLPNKAISTDAVTAGKLSTEGTYLVSSTGSNTELLSAMTTPNYWSHLITGKLQKTSTNAGMTPTAKGSPTVEQFKESWNSQYPGEITTEGNETSGWPLFDVSTCNGYSNVPESDNVYFPHKSQLQDSTGACFGYWMASPCSTGPAENMVMTYNGNTEKVSPSYTHGAFRPVIRIPFSILIPSDGRGIWDINYMKYTVEFNANTGEGTMDNQVLFEGESINLQANTFTKSGYTFSHWNTKADGTGRNYNDKQLVKDLAGNGETITLYAQWYESSLNKVKYAVQIYGINQDVDANNHEIGLTFGPATGANYNNSYVTHEYDANQSGTYDVMIVTHNVAEDGSETIASRVALTNSSGAIVTRTLEEKQKYDVNLREISWKEIEETTDKSVFKDCMLCGDTKSVFFTLNTTISSGTKQTAYGDGAGVLYSTVNGYYRRWNPAKSNSTSSANNSAVGTGVTLDSNEQNYGSNARNAGAYKTSHIRATLIGSDVSNPTIGYAGDVNLDSTTCLYSCIESGLKDVITPKKVKYVTGRSSSDYDANNTPLVDSIWLLSNREVYGTGEYSGNTTEGLGTNGDGYSKFGNTESKYYMSTYNTSSTANRTAYNEAGSANIWWLRSPRLYDTYITYSVYSEGNINYYHSYSTRGLGLGFCIGTHSKVSFDSNGGAGAMEDQTIMQGVPTNLTANSFTKSGYTFSHWNTKADGTGRSYNDKQLVTTAIASNGSVKLYAQWYDSSLNKVKYAVQIYGINQDVDANNNEIGLTFGPATGANYNNSYVTHEYDANQSGTYDVMIVTHNVAEDGSETIASRVALTNSSGAIVTRTLEEKQKYDVNLREISWKEIEETTDKSVFKDCMLCGDTKSVFFTLNTTISSGTKQTAYGDGAGVLYSTVNGYYRRWNPAKSNSTSSANNSAVGTGVTLDSNEQQYGSNAKNAGAYKTSHIRATLIGSDVSNPTIGYAGDVNLDSTTCLYSCIESGLKDVITPKKVKYVTGRSSSDYDANNTPLVDSIWLLSNREVYGTGEYSGNTTEGLGTNGDGYSKFGNTESKYYMSTYNTSSTANRTAYNEAGSANIWWLRSPRLYDTYITYSVYSEGNINYYHSYSTRGLGLGFCIGTHSKVSFDSNGGAGAMEDQTIMQGVPTNLTANSFTKSGYTFSHWNTKADGTGRSYNDKQLVTSKIGAVTLYAQWYDSSFTKGKYAVQIYGINQDVDANDETLGLTFGPAVGANYNNSYVTHEYDANGSGTYDVMIVTHNVAEDGSETIASRVALTNSSGATVTRTALEKQKYDINLHEMSWKEIEAVGDKSKFLDCMLCGDTKGVNLILNDTIGSGATHTAYGDGAGALSTTIKNQAGGYYKVWNPSSSQDSGVTSNGGQNAITEGGYKTSHIRATLIGADVSNPTTSYAGNVNLDSTTCLYSCIENGLQGVITPKKVKYVTGSDYDGINYNTNNTPLVDSIWLFSVREMYGIGRYSGYTTEGLGSSGNGYSKFGNNQSKYYMSAYNENTTNNRIACNENGTNEYWWLRSPSFSGNQFSVHSVYNNGAFYPRGDAYVGNAISFGFCIK